MSGACVSAEAATLLIGAGVFGLLKSFDAFDATDLEVRSFLDIVVHLLEMPRFRSTPNPTPPTVYLDGEEASSASSSPAVPQRSAGPQASELALRRLCFHGGIFKFTELALNTSARTEARAALFQ